MEKNIKLAGRKLIVVSAVIALVFTVTGCNKFLDIPLPVNSLAGNSVFQSDNSAGAVATQSLKSLYKTGLVTGGTSISFTSGLYSDELKPLIQNTYIGIYGDADVATSGDLPQWTYCYSTMYTVNSTIAGVSTTGNKLFYRNQWLGESYFTRALLYYYLVNMYGDVPLALGTDYSVNNKLARTPQAQVYAQIIADLKLSQSMLTDQYNDGAGQNTTNRTRPNKAAATALLARVYLYQKDWKDAEIEADSVISNSQYALGDLSGTFLAGSQETIFSVSPLSDGYVSDWNLYVGGLDGMSTFNNVNNISNAPQASLSPSLANAFEPNDKRFKNWVKTVQDVSTTPATNYYFPYKYKTNTLDVENVTILRLAEVYLIRAEARAELNETAGAQDDINTIRTRAGLPNTTAADQTSLLAAIAQERRVELFTESQRFFDLKRTGTITAVMNSAATGKGNSWTTNAELWPIPISDIQQDPNLKQNPGYIQ